MDIIPTSAAEMQVLLGRVSDWFDGKVASIGRKEKIQKAPVAREKIINGVVAGRQPENEAQLANLIGPHLKLAVVLSETGKLFSIDLSTSEILWSKMEEKDCIIDRVKNGPKIWLRVSHSNGKYDYIEPATGEIAESGSLPASSVGHTYSLNGTDFIGYYEGKEAWTVRFNDDSERLVSIVEPQQDYFGHVPVVVKSDASVLYRYINSNLIGVVTENAQGYVIVRMVDSVTGALVYETKIPHAADPLMVIFDNSAVVYYRNDKANRYELLVVDLFKDRDDYGFWDTMKMSKAAAKATDGAIEGNATRVSAYALEMPISATQQFVFPQAVTSIGVSTTQKGVTPRSVFFGLASGKVLAVNKDTVLNPRRQTVKPVSDRSSRLQNIAGDKEHDASVPPYTPLVPIKSTDIVSYDNEVENIKFIRTTPTHFESTSLLVVIGLDMYMSPTNTAQRYDLLGPDFDYPLLTISIAVGKVACSVPAGLAPTVIQATCQRLGDDYSDGAYDMEDEDDKSGEHKMGVIVKVSTKAFTRLFGCIVPFGLPVLPLLPEEITSLGISNTSSAVPLSAVPGDSRSPNQGITDGARKTWRKFVDYSTLLI
ncbi:DUF1620 super [Perkinsus chesapeaki]|uniref:ER membrane protein complex subunit 1 n=1 Tax=Perkinsus chesapeaki TaxID=330153 RepID=A0A7J6LQM1_PERCH|nr:DUF1620 super [Perkinsus chesapeaki]